MADAAAPPQLTKDQAKELLEEVEKLLWDNEENRNKLLAAIKEVREGPTADDPMQQKMALVQKLMPMVSEFMGQVLQKYGFADANESHKMAAMMQIQMHSMGDPKMMETVQKIMKALSGDYA